MTKEDILNAIYDDTIKSIDKHIVNIYNGEVEDDNVCDGQASLLYVRKTMLNERIAPYLHLFADDIKAFNEALIATVRDAYIKGLNVYEALEQLHEPYSKDIKIRLYFQDAPSNHHPANEDECQDLWDVLTDRTLNREYANGINITPIYIPFVYQTVEEYLGIDDGTKWDEGLEERGLNDAKLNMAFHHLYHHCMFSLIDIMFVREFRSETDIKMRSV